MDQTGGFAASSWLVRQAARRALLVNTCRNDWVRTSAPLLLKQWGPFLSLSPRCAYVRCGPFPEDVLVMFVLGGLSSVFCYGILSHMILYANFSGLSQLRVSSPTCAKGYIR